MSSARPVRRLASKISFVLPLALAGWVVAVGCGGEAEEIPNTSGSPDAGQDAPPSSTTDAGETPTDASKPVKDASNFDAASIDAPEVTLDFGTCPDFVGCGGTVDGTYKMTGGCVSDKFLEQGKQYCAGLVVSDVVVKGKGIVTATASTISRSIFATLSAKLELPCGAAVGLLGGCAGVESFLMNEEVVTDATCTDRAGGGCNCTVKGEILNQASGAYTTSGNTLTAGQENYEYCAQGVELGLYSEAGFPTPLTIELAK